MFRPAGFLRPRLRAAAALVAVVAGALSAGCENVDVKAALHVTDVITGYYDIGVIDGKNKLVPGIAFKIKNDGGDEVSSTQFNAVFRVIGDQEELGSALVKGIDANGLPPGQTTQTYVMRSSLGYTGQQPRAQMLQHKDFRDVQVEVFAKHGANQWVKLSQYKVDRQLLTN